MHLHADDDLPVAGRAFDEFRGLALHVHVDVLLPFKSRLIAGNVKAARCPPEALVDAYPDTGRYNQIEQPATGG